MPDLACRSYQEDSCNSAEQSSALKAYLQTVQAWIERGCPEGAPYSRRFGLCRNAYKFEFNGSINSSLTLAFHQQKLNITYPFNSSAQEYDNESTTLGIYQNPQRLEWIKNHAQNPN